MMSWEERSGSKSGGGGRSVVGTKENTLVNGVEQWTRSAARRMIQRSFVTIISRRRRPRSIRLRRPCRPSIFESLFQLATRSCRRRRGGGGLEERGPLCKFTSQWGSLFALPFQFHPTYRRGFAYVFSCNSFLAQSENVMLNIYFTFLILNYLREKLNE